MQQETSALLGILGVLAVGVVSPGPSFVLIARTAVASSRADGVAAAFGMGGGGLVFAMAALLGLHGVLLAVPSLYIVLKIAGGLYLGYLGVRIWSSARQPLTIPTLAPGSRKNLLKSVALGFTTQISNPKPAIVYASVFAAFLPESPSLGFNVAIVVLAFTIETAWYAVVAVALSSEGPRSAYLRYKAWMDRVAGGVMLALGLKLVASAPRI
jgi:threonine/homoserine/homoserine lactone efflux protein